VFVVLFFLCVFTVVLLFCLYCYCTLCFTVVLCYLSVCDVDNTTNTKVTQNNSKTQRYNNSKHTKLKQHHKHKGTVIVPLCFTVVLCYLSVCGVVFPLCFYCCFTFLFVLLLYLVFYYTKVTQNNSKTQRYNNSKHTKLKQHHKHKGKTTPQTQR
jgi:uncharacterized ion transporter superfamily protein YfcC